MADNWQTTFLVISKDLNEKKVINDGIKYSGEFKDGNIVKKGNN